MNHLRNGYIAKFFKDFYFIPAIFITSILCTLAIGSEGFGLFDIIGKGNFAYYLISAGGYFLILYVIYALAECKNKKLSVLDPANFAILLTSVIYVLFVVFVSKSSKPLKFIIPGALFVLMIFITTMRNIFFNPYDDKGTVYYTKHSVNGYYHTLLKNHSFFAIFLFALCITCLAFLIITKGYTLKLTSSKMLIPLIAVGIFTSLLIFTSISKKISVLDASILGATISLPPVLAQILFLSPTAESKKLYLIYFAVLALVFVILTVLRYVFFDNSKISKTSTINFSDNGFVDYLKKISHKYGIGNVFTISFAAAIVLYLMLTFADVTTLYTIKDNVLYVKDFSILPAIIVNLLFIGSMLMGVVLTLANIKAIKVTFADVMMLINLIFSIVAAGIFALQKTFDWRIYSLAVLFIYSLLMTIFRIIRFSLNKIDKTL